MIIDLTKTSDGNKIQTALDTMATNSGEIRLGPHIYYCRKPLKYQPSDIGYSLTIRGSGGLGAGTWANSGTVIYGANLNKPLFTTTGANGLVLSDLKLRADGTRAVLHINAKNTTGQSPPSSNILLEKVRLIGQRGALWIGRKKTGATDQVSELTFRDCIFDAGDTCVWVWQSGNTKQFQFFRSHFRHAELGYHGESNGTVGFYGCHFETEKGLHLRAGNYTVQDCYTESTENYFLFHRCGANSSNIEITNCQLSGKLGTKPLLSFQGTMHLRGNWLNNSFGDPVRIELTNPLMAANDAPNVLFSTGNAFVGNTKLHLYDGSGNNILESPYYDDKRIGVMSQGDYGTPPMTMYEKIWRI